MIFGRRALEAISRSAESDFRTAAEASLFSERRDGKRINDSDPFTGAPRTVNGQDRLAISVYFRHALERTSPMRTPSRLIVPLLFASAAMISSGQNTAGFPVQAQKQVVKYISELANLHCKESVTQEKLSSSGHVQTTERSSYDYLVMMEGNGDDFQLNESRLETKAGSHKSLPMLVTNGFSTLLLVFHPYYSGAFEFTQGPEEVVNGIPTSTVLFKHIHGQRTLAALALRNREFPLELQGTAWLDKNTGEVLKMESNLIDDMSDIGLRSLKVHVDYRQIHLGGNTGTMTLPVLATVEVATPRQHWRNTHTFTDYKVFGAQAEQDPNVKVKEDKKVDANPASHPQAKEKP